MQLKHNVILIVLIGAGNLLAQDYVPGELIVKFKSQSGSSKQSGQFSKMQSQGLALKSSYGKMNIQHFAMKPGSDVLAKVRELKNDPDVEYAEPNWILRKSDLTNQPLGQPVTLSDIQVNIQAAGSYSQSNAPTQTTQAWAIERTLAQYSEKPVVAVIDTGVDYNHDIFKNSGAIWTNSREVPNNGIDDDGNGYIDDVRGWNFFGNNNNPMDDDSHGTHCAGIILGVGQDIFATTMEASRIRIMPLKFLGADGSGSTSSAISAIYYAVNNGAQVISNSWGGGGYSQALYDALAYAYNNRVFLAAAAGNSAKNNDTTAMYPANYVIPSQISVGATSDSDSLASFSNFGKSTVHLTAPGVYILSSIPTVGSPSNRFAYMSGTSMATPYVAGLAALVMREAPSLTGYQVKNVIMNNLDIVSGLSSKIVSSGRVNAYRAVSSGKGEINTMSSQPALEMVRAPASSQEVSSSSKGCGTVKDLNSFSNSESNPSMPPGLFVLFAIPLAVWIYLQRRQKSQDPKNRRVHDRFKMDSEIKINVGGRELVAHMKTISQGGLSFEIDSMIEKGGVVTMNIASPDGSQQVQVMGQVVWCEKNQAYGVKFSELQQKVSEQIGQWTNGLSKVS